MAAQKHTVNKECYSTHKCLSTGIGQHYTHKKTHLKYGFGAVLLSVHCNAKDCLAIESFFSQMTATRYIVKQHISARTSILRWLAIGRMPKLAWHCFTIHVKLTHKNVPQRKLNCVYLLPNWIQQDLFTLMLIHIQSITFNFTGID